ncbi:hypothetical protein GLOTRDRAFT_129295 [Gloeophyllum trabeum ATCC 11539]|uniref:Uncharacterized protein n=1 Tax=Gloeophyllum trabeum (strain ATCC 11539 / FP-39264 / Madison 617) TaxID=670483 RepID=S7RQ30_GLOTA|nr:uncharacterized protein GLOTRDRAFT_129295 [Gloeophyllum trabeum ATCC 11539]EPQ54989.1 hypothetical protein GLOTRDRAFT_129295 [Gloeophyllum trabeum ATCC 11539]
MAHSSSMAHMFSPNNCPIMIRDFDGGYVKFIAGPNLVQSFTHAQPLEVPSGYVEYAELFNNGTQYWAMLVQTANGVSLTRPTPPFADICGHQLRLPTEMPDPANVLTDAQRQTLTNYSFTMMNSHNTRQKFNQWKKEERQQMHLNKRLGNMRGQGCNWAAAPPPYIPPPELTIDFTGINFNLPPNRHCHHRLLIHPMFGLSLAG